MLIKMKEMNESKKKKISEMEMIVDKKKDEIDGVINIKEWRKIYY